MSQPKQAIRRILIVDDHAVVRRGLALMIGMEPDLEVAAEACSMDDAVGLLKSVSLDLALVDLSLQGPSGLDLIRHISAQHPSVRTLALSMYDESIWLDRVLRAGGHGFVSKDASIEVLMSAVRKVLSGGVYISEQAQARAFENVKAANASAETLLLPRLSNRELEVLTLIGQGLGTAEIASLLSRSVKTVESHKENLKQKLGLKTGVALMRYAVEHSLNPSGKS